MRQQRYIRWRAVIDGRTCPVCYELQGQIVDTYDPVWKLIKPPRHLYCRCSAQPIAVEDLPLHLQVPSLAPPPLERFEWSPWLQVRAGLARRH